jgi:nucleotide-binding universal stress UspA family protein
VKKAMKVVVGLKTVEQAAELVELACLMSRPDATLLLVHVIELPDNTPLDADVPDLDEEGRKILHVGEEVARREVRKRSTRLVRAHSAAQAMLEELKESHADLAVLSYHHKRTISELVFGTTARHLVRHAPCQLLISVPPRR